MVYRVLGDLVMAAHFGFLAFLAVGGFLAWWRPWLLYPHVLTAAWGLASATVGLTCPLTGWEDALRRRAGQDGLARGFIDTYLTGVVYPAEHLLTAQLLVGVLVVASWVGLAVRRRPRRPAAAP